MRLLEDIRVGRRFNDMVNGYPISREAAFKHLKTVCEFKSIFPDCDIADWLYEDKEKTHPILRPILVNKLSHVLRAIISHRKDNGYYLPFIDKEKGYSDGVTLFKGNNDIVDLLTAAMVWGKADPIQQELFATELVGVRNAYGFCWLMMVLSNE